MKRTKNERQTKSKKTKKENIKNVILKPNP